MSDAMILRCVAITLVGILSAVLLPTGAGLGSYIAPGHGINVHFDAYLFLSGTEMGALVYWPLGVIGFICVVGGAFIRVRGRALNMSIAWTCLPLVYAIGILIGIVLTAWGYPSNISL